MSSAWPARFRALRRRAVAVCVGVVIAAGAMGYVLSRPPVWWQPPGRTDAVAVDAGERFENAWVTELHRIRPSGEKWAVRVRDADINAWLATRLPKWMEHAGSSNGLEAMVRCRASRLEIAARLDGWTSVAVVRCEPTMEQGELRLGSLRARLGDLPLPFLRNFLANRLIGAIAADDGPDELRSLASLLAGEPATPRFSLGDGRVVHLRDIEVDDGEVRLEFTTDVEGRPVGSKGHPAGS